MASKKTGAALLSSKQWRFIQEYLLDGNGFRAAVAAGYAPHSARTTASRLLTKDNVSDAIAIATEERAARLRVTGDRVIQELARIAFADPRDYDGDDFDLQRLDADQAAAISTIDTIETTDRRTGDVRRLVRVRLHDKASALNTLAKSLGMLTDKHLIQGSVEHLIKQMTPAERAERVRQLRERGAALLPEYRAQQTNGEIDPSPIIDAEVEDVLEGAEAGAPQAVAVGGRHGNGSTPSIAACPEETAEAMRQRAGNGLGGEIDDPPERAAWDRDRR